MQINDRSNSARAATQRSSLIATAAAFAALTAFAFVLLHPPAGHAARTNGPVVSTATTIFSFLLGEQ